ncbi:vegetative cell wall protein gp1 [Triticum aestivum]|uniref:vegetative cell wall protein gp1 n=1 Tax=Triticum aestivum TaxID=4565 RepID=UPI001D002652|nr:vegetative cell wall protein gp1-like [Triticum aestivum]
MSDHVPLFPQLLRRVQFHLSCKWGWKAKTTARRLAQPDEELEGVIPDVALHQGRGRWWRLFYFRNLREREKRVCSPAPPWPKAQPRCPLLTLAPSPPIQSLPLVSPQRRHLPRYRVRFPRSPSPCARPSPRRPPAAPAPPYAPPIASNSSTRAAPPHLVSLIVAAHEAPATGASSWPDSSPIAPSPAPGPLAGLPPPAAPLQLLLRLQLHPLADAAPGPSPTSSSSLRPFVTTGALAGASASRARGSKPLRHLPGQVKARADPKLSCAAVISRRRRSGKITSAASSPSCASREPAFLAEPRGVALLRQLAPLHGQPPLPVHASGFVQVRCYFCTTTLRRPRPPSPHGSPNDYFHDDASTSTLFVVFAKYRTGRQVPLRVDKTGKPDDLGHLRKRVPLSSTLEDPVDPEHLRS